ncbi:hypothetical protein IHV09_19100 [Fictibacillus sp. 23RED33]|nr:hypothetical protein [Fictibacillus sp. 23RED33]
MILSLEEINLSGNKNAEVFLHRTSDRRFIVAIPTIHWSAEFEEVDKISIQTEHLQNSLNYHLFDGDTNKLADSIIELVKKYA